LELDQRFTGLGGHESKANQFGDGWRRHLSTYRLFDAV